MSVKKQFTKMVSRGKVQSDVKILVLQLAGAAGDCGKAAQVNNDRLVNSLGKYEHILHQLLGQMGIERTWVEADENPSYTLPALLESTLELCKAVGNRKATIKPLENIEKVLSNVYFVLKKASGFDGQESIITEDDVLLTRIKKFN